MTLFQTNFVLSSNQCMAPRWKFSSKKSFNHIRVAISVKNWSPCRSWRLRANGPAQFYFRNFKTIKSLQNQSGGNINYANVQSSVHGLRPVRVSFERCRISGVRQNEQVWPGGGGFVWKWVCLWVDIFAWCETHFVFERESERVVKRINYIS